MLLWLWRRPAATAPIRPLAWEPPRAMGAALKRQKYKRKRKKEKKKRNLRSTSWTPSPNSPLCGWLPSALIHPPRSCLLSSLKQICLERSSDSCVHNVAKALHFPVCSLRQDLKFAAWPSCLAAAGCLLLGQTVLVREGSLTMSEQEGNFGDRWRPSLNS